MTSARWLLLVAFILGAGLRLYHLDRNPQGTHPDEILYAYEGWAIQTTGCDYRQTGCPPLYLKGYSAEWDNRTSVLYPYLFAGLWWVLPKTLFIIRLPSVLFGLAIIPLGYLFLRRLFPNRPLIAGTGAILSALSPTMIAWSRVGHDPITMPFFTLVIAVAILSAERRPWCWVIAGLALVVGMYGYQPFKVIGPGVALATLWYARPAWRGQERWLTVAALASAIVVAPFLINQLTKWSTVQSQFASMVVFHHDHSWRRILENLGQFPLALVTRPAISLLFVPVVALAGWLVLWRRPRRLGGYFTLIVVISLIPVLLTSWPVGGNEMQSRGLLVFALLDVLGAIGLTALGQWLLRWSNRVLAWSIMTFAVTGVVVLISLSAVTNRVKGGFCCFIFGGIEQATAVLQQPPYAQRQVVFERENFMQGVNILWFMKVSPRSLRDPLTRWGDWPNGDEMTEIPEHVGRYDLCYPRDCFRPNDGRLYVVPIDRLPDQPVIATFDLNFWWLKWKWKIVDNTTTVGDPLPSLTSQSTMTL